MPVEEHVKLKETQLVLYRLLNKIGQIKDKTQLEFLKKDFEDGKYILSKYSKIIGALRWENKKE